MNPEKHRSRLVWDGDEDLEIRDADGHLIKDKGDPDPENSEAETEDKGDPDPEKLPGGSD